MKAPVRVGSVNSGERGSALLIVFVFAAMAAIMLYMEMPVAVFEAQRQKEQLLIDRGGEYSHAVKLFVRKLGTYPVSIEALEKTNQVRFLRHRFKDPFTGKDDWRILHAGPNGMLMDSKVKPLANGQNGSGANGPNAQNGSSTGTTAFGSASNSSNGTQGSTGFGSNGFGAGGSDSSSTNPEVVVAPLPQRGPAIAAGGSGQSSAAGAADQNPFAPLVAPGQTDTSAAGQPVGAPPGGTPGQNGAGPGANGPAGNGSVADAFRNALTNPNGPVQQGVTGGSTFGTSQTGTGLGTIVSGGIAGVASKASGHSIKTVNDQSDYSLWEFYYDPTKDAARGIANALGAGQQGNTQQNGFGQSPQQQQQNGFGTNNGTGSSSGTNSLFGSSPNGSNGNTATPFPSPGTQQQEPPQ